ncbi:putative transporter [Campylobacter sp. MG1]|uniref:putative transporter n=1 Tax=Campylobacter sp. MG1 TaxID=2976332 RepID=UPI00226CBED4|nr:putative transporter [Campylobacter sp. MG1]
MFKSFYLTKKWFFWAWGGTAFILLSLYAQTWLNVQINAWYKDFYDLLQKAPKDSTYEQFISELFNFSYIAFPYVLISTITAYFSRLFAFAWREAITFAYLNQWKNNNENIEGSSQRIQEDIYRFAKIIESLGISIVKALMTLIAFLPILYEVGKGLKTPIFESDFSLIYWAILASIGGLIISWFVGIKLPHLEYNNQKAEAKFRKELVLAEDDRKNYASDKTMFELFTGLKINYNKLFLHYGYFDIWLYTYEQFMVIFAFILVGENLFLGTLSLGVLIQINNAFSNVRASFSVLTQNWTTITELRSIFIRLSEFEKHISFK